MIQVRRSSNVFVLLSDRSAIDLDAFFSGTVKVEPRMRALGISLVTGRTTKLTPAILELLASIDSTTWQSGERLLDRFDVNATDLARLVKYGFLITDDSGPKASEMRELDARLDRVNWDPYQALAYVMARWTDTGPAPETDGLGEVLEDFDRLVGAYGKPPGHFHRVESLGRIQLPEAKPGSQLHRILLNRYTAREFRTDKPMPQEHLAELLYFTFGAQNEIRLAEDFTVLRKTSPSGGAMHPVEAYPLILNVQGLDCGIYHYNVGNHCLDLMQSMTEDDARDMALKITTGQDYFASADLMVVLTGRYERTFWKYRNHGKARRVVELDSGHLSQTFYLLATRLGYGPFITAAIGDGHIEGMLDLPFLKEGPIAVIGCGTSVENQKRLG